jgi:Protein of unknown function (DUF1570)
MIARNNPEGRDGTLMRNHVMTWRPFLELGRVLVAGLVALLAAAARGEAPQGEEKNSPEAALSGEKAVLEEITFRADLAQQVQQKQPAERKVAGRVLIEAQDGGLLVLGQDGRIWTVSPEFLVSRRATEAPFTPLSSQALAAQLRGELGAQYEVTVTKHYVIASRAGKAYTRWCGALFERLFTSFHTFWKKRGVALREPEFPLVAIILADEQQFAGFAQADAGLNASDAKGYFSIPTNRMVLYDLTAGAGPNVDISQRLAAAPFNIATVIHEATHQIAFNSGMHVRLADNPLWLTEGMAMYFETPDLHSRTGWKTVGAVNGLRLGQFGAYAAARRGADSLETLLKSDARFTNAETMTDAYSEAWALSYFLIRTRKEAYHKYLEQLADKPPLVFDDPEKRLAEFRAAFGDDLKKLDAEMLAYIRRLKRK